MGLGCTSAFMYLTDFPAGGRIEWTLAADGYAPVFGTEGDFALSEGVDTAEVALRRGWATRLRVVAAGARHPIVGAVVVLDGDHVATTDATGHVELFRAIEPQQIEILYPKWEVLGDVSIKELGALKLRHEVKMALR